MIAGDHLAADRSTRALLPILAGAARILTRPRFLGGRRATSASQNEPAAPRCISRCRTGGQPIAHHRVCSPLPTK
jgi:hypothetical protein